MDVAPWLKVAVVRGDVAAAGLMLAVTGLVLAAVWIGGVGAVPGLLALGAIPTGVWLILWWRRQYAVLLADVVARHRDHDPGPSPAPWVSDALWRARNAFRPEFDAADTLLAEVEGRKTPLQAAVRAFEGPVLRPVADAERGLAPVGEAVGEPPPEGTADEQVARLMGTPGRFIGGGVRWPVCCGRLAVLVAEGPSSADGALVLGEPGADLQPDRGRASHGFQCAACGRRYATQQTW